MAYVALAVSQDVVDALGRALTSAETARVQSILDKASELFRRRSGQNFTTGTSTVRLKVNGGRVYLPQVPVVSITSVVDDDGDAVVYTQQDQWLVTERLSHEFVTVNYSHGSTTVPDLVRLTIADVARQILTINANAQAGMSQFSETRGPFTDSGSYATWAIGGSTRLSPEDLAIADTYKIRVPNVVVMQP